MKTTTVKIPGKLFLAGEYAVTKPGQPALLAAVDRGLTIRVEETDRLMPGSLVVKSDAMPEPLVLTWSALADLTQETSDSFLGSWSFVKAALVLFYQEHLNLQLTQQPGLSLTISSQMAVDHNKLGLGSSAAVSVAIIKGLVAYFNLEDRLPAIFRQAAFAHYFIQGSGSLGDLASATFTGVIFYQAPNWLNQVDSKTLTLADFSKLDWSNLAIKPLPWPKNWQIGIVATFQPASTKKALAKGFWQTDFARQSKEAVTKAALAIENHDYHGLMQGLKNNQDLLRKALPTGYLTPALSQFLTLLGQRGLAGKVSGAGYGDNGFVVFENQTQGHGFHQASQGTALHLLLPALWQDSVLL
ncbi:phosphomevalonate kinase [Fructobacillus evanidus]|uniref:phosphomevalonate kinase n=1 Tax=Fructobacillus evanidus TaxID=3064281 RepID=A0ABM9MLM8_9LACO|nr:Mevalonate kinase (ERG12) [Fructobacillus sp. LMG 32999]CAK1222423.1 Mevalonate kinase (ERG12) [Fructobacillus sp. LMG 32999]CAK1224543.1 Mevalonate kinase (ERG12) [Fructobacillus sp. LMG 32999]CAK1224730.1 Mevalonate kinase (ERG12) [Fructobacillus sp. LMG 32999]CAK1224896.1 Mevalonate kinase (ERG12) [Fructobacillus sp. LMG 32999]